MPSSSDPTPQISMPTTSLSPTTLSGGMEMLKVVLQPNGDKVASELIEDEAIIINVATGTYYNTQGAGGWVWEQCAAGRSLAEIARLGCARYGVCAEQMQSDLLAFAEVLKAEDLVIEKAAGPVDGGSEESVATEKHDYVAPTLVIYRDLKDLLALDPPMPRLGVDEKYGS